MRSSPPPWMTGTPPNRTARDTHDPRDGRSARGRGTEAPGRQCSAPDVARLARLRSAVSPLLAQKRSRRRCGGAAGAGGGSDLVAGVEDAEAQVDVVTGGLLTHINPPIASSTSRRSPRVHPGTCSARSSSTTRVEDHPARLRLAVPHAVRRTAGRWDHRLRRPHARSRAPGSEATPAPERVGVQVPR